MINIRNYLEAKTSTQDDTMTFYDNIVWDAQFDNSLESQEVRFNLDFVLESKKNRFCSHVERIKRTDNEQRIHHTELNHSQGTHSLISWKGLSLYKTAYDLVIYSMLISELQPNIIVEYGSGSGGSAVWMSDIAIAHGLDTKVFSYDLKKPNHKHKNIDFIECDLTHKMDFNWGKGRKMVFEDAHVNIVELLLQTDRNLESGDYLIVEDSGNHYKQESISQFLDEAKNRYEVDQYYLDFFGKNTGSCIDSIFKVV